MGISRILSKCDDALVAYIIAGGAGTAADTWPAKRSLDKDQVPVTICWSHTAAVLQEGPFSGLRQVEAFVEVRTSAIPQTGESSDEPKSKYIDRVSNTFDLFNVGSGGGSDHTAGQALGTAITQAGGIGDFSIMFAEVVQETQGHNPISMTQQGNGWVDSIHLRLICAPGNIL